MLFRTKFLLAIAILSVVALSCAALLIVSSQRNAQNQTRTMLASESLAGYLQIQGEIFRTFKQARRDLLSGPGTFAFDFPEARLGMIETLGRLERLAVEEASALPDHAQSIQNARLLKTKVMGALDEISAASVLITSGSAEIGRSKTIEVLEQTIDVEVNNLIEAEISRERESLQRAESEMQRFNELTQTVAIVSVILALLISVFIVLILSRRLTMGLRALETGARAYAADDLDHVIDLPGEDELSAVAGRFNDMAQQILTKHRALEEIRDELEDMVDSRTEELSTAVSELQERDTSRRRFFADIGHELRTPVTAIRGEAEVALRSRSDNEANYQNALVQIVSLSEQLTDFVTDLFLVAREQAGVLDFRDRELDLNIPVKRGIEAIGSIAAEKGARVDQRFADVPLPIMGNEKHIAQLVQILVTNALLHARAGVNIALSTRRDGDHVLLAIEDDGPGIAPKDRSRIFDRFAKGQPSRDATGSSTGLGLAIAKSITQAHGGSISVGDSEMGGARFVASFPVPELEDAA